MVGLDNDIHLRDSFINKKDKDKVNMHVREMVNRKPSPPKYK